MGGIVAAVAPRSLAARVGLRVGDELLAINGEPVRDVIDVQFYAAEAHLALRVRRDGETRIFEARRRYNEPLGLDFAHPTFDSGIRRCRNRCEFCFVTQMPPGMRPAVYVKDDDYRYSFLFGNYVTLTNLTEDDWERIAEQYLSPLYVSVQATEPALRRRILLNPQAPDVMDQLRRLVELGVEVHTQIVLLPEVNDGVHLDHSIADLASLYPGVRSVSVVPVGLTRYHEGGCRLHTQEEARVVFEQVRGWQERLLPTLGAHFAYLSDEWYLRLGEPIPPAEAYDGLDLTENGVGLVRRFLDAWAGRGGEDVRSLSELEPATLVTGTLFAPVLASLVAGRRAEVIAVANIFFGEMVSVAGLLTARDVIEQLEGRRLEERLVLPAATFGGPEGRSLDGLLPEDVEAALGRPVVLASLLRP